MSDASAVAQDQLRALVERIERLEEEKRTIADDIKDVYAEAKASGFDTKVLRKVIALRKLDANERAEFDAVLDLYLEALGMQSGLTPDLPMEMERVRRADRPKSGIDQALAKQADTIRREVGIGPALAKAAAEPTRKPKRPTTADEARERIAAVSLTFN